MPRVRIGRLRLLGNLTLAMVVFMASYLLDDLFVWDWPIYSLFALFLLQFMMALLAGNWRRTARLLSWSCGFYLLFMTVFTVQAIFKDAGIFIHVFSAVPEVAGEYPLVFYPTLAALLVVMLLPLYFRWRRLYGWHTAYRILLLALFALAAAVLLGGRLLELAQQRALLPDQSLFLDEFVKKTKPSLDNVLGLFALFTFRILIFEIFITSALQGYRAASRTRLQAAGGLAGQTGFVRSLIVLGLVVRRFLLLVENMVRSLGAALADMGRSLWAVTRAFARDLLTPALALSIGGGLLYGLTGWTRAYIDENSLEAVLKILGAVAGILACMMLLLTALSHFRLGRIVRFTLEFGGWLLPNLLVFFLLMSLSLWLTGLFLNRPDSEHHLPFQIGPLTEIDMGLLVVLVGIVLWRHRSVFKVDLAPAAPATPEPAPAPVAPAVTGPAVTGPAVSGPAVTGGENAGGGKIRTPRLGRLKQVFRRNRGPAAPGEAAPAASAAPAHEEEEKNGGSLLGRLAESARGTVRGSLRTIGKRMQGKPIVEQLAQLRQRREEKIVQLRSLEKLRATISTDAHEKLWVEARGELTYIEAEMRWMQVELDKQYGIKLMDKAKLEARLAVLRQLVRETGEAPDDLEKEAAAAALDEIEALQHQLEECEREAAVLAVEAGQAVGKTK